MPEYLQNLSTNDIFGAFMILSRVGSAMMFFPGFAENYVNIRARIGLALLITIVLLPVLLPQMPDMPASVGVMVMFLFTEVFVGAFFGLVARVLFSALEVAGMAISFQLSLGNATIFNPAMATQGSIVSVFLTVSAIVLLFVTNMHHLMLRAVVDSYSLFTPGAPPPVGDMAQYYAHTMNMAFRLSVQFAAPLLVFGLTFFLGLGLLGRLMPQMQVFFVAIPLQVLLGFFMLLLTVSSLMMWFLAAFENTLENYLSVP